MRDPEVQSLQSRWEPSSQGPPGEFGLFKDLHKDIEILRSSLFTILGVLTDAEESINLISFYVLGMPVAVFLGFSSWIWILGAEAVPTYKGGQFIRTDSWAVLSAHY
ncbi:hypothetical protein ACLOJK_001599 [Asimina triloba]